MIMNMLEFYNTLSRNKEDFQPWQINWYQLRDNELLKLKGNLLKEIINLGIKKAGNLNQLCKSISMSYAQFLFVLKNQTKTNLISVRKLRRIAHYLGINYNYFNDKISEIRKGKIPSIKNPKFPFNLATKEGTAILGNIVSDGCIFIDKKARNVKRTKYSAGTEEEADSFVNNINRIFGEVYFRKEPMRNITYLRIGSSIIAESLCKVGAPVGNKTANDPKLPWLVKYGSKELKITYLKAIFDDEGCVAGKEQNPYINRLKRKRYDFYITLSRSIHINKYLNENQKRLLKKIESYMRERKFPTGHKIKAIEIKKAIGILKAIKENTHSIDKLLLETKPKLLKEESKMLSLLGIKNKIRNSRLDLTDKGNYSVVSELRIQKRENILNFYKKVNFNLSYKKEKFKKLLLNKKWI